MDTYRKKQGNIPINWGTLFLFIIITFGLTSSFREQVKKVETT